MPVLITSDIHGSRDGVRLLQNAIRKFRPESIISAGDQCPDEENASFFLSLIAVRGNCEAEVDQMVLPFPVLSESAVVFADDKTIFLTHGHIWNEERHPEGIDVFLSGHTHIPVIRERDGILFFNPGSVSIPKGGSDASYGEWIDGSLRILSLSSRQMMMEAGTQA